MKFQKVFRSTWAGTVFSHTVRAEPPIERCTGFSKTASNARFRFLFALEFYKTEGLCLHPTRDSSESEDTRICRPVNGDAERVLLLRALLDAGGCPHRGPLASP
jgi:hypothetical protein